MSLLRYCFRQFKACAEGKRRYLGFLLVIAIGCLSTPVWAGKHGVAGLNYYILAELASLIVSFVSCLYYLFTYNAFQRTANIIFSLAWLIALSLHIVAIGFVLRHDALGLVASIFGIAYAYGLIDHLVGQRHPKEIQRNEYEASFILADLPAMAGLAFLFVATLFREEDSNWIVFVSGASALHLILCNFTFFVVQIGLHKYTPPSPDTGH